MTMIRRICDSLTLLVLLSVSVTTLPSTLAENQDITCYDEFEQAYIGRIPHPTSCSVFLKCIEESPGRPLPILQLCPGDLKFNFDVCDCDWPVNAVCYDPSNPEHNRNKFQCADRLESDQFHSK